MLSLIDDLHIVHRLLIVPRPVQNLFPSLVSQQCRHWSIDSRMEQQPGQESSRLQRQETLLFHDLWREQVVLRPMHEIIISKRKVMKAINLVCTNQHFESGNTVYSVFVLLFISCRDPLFDTLVSCDVVASFFCPVGCCCCSMYRHCHSHHHHSTTLFVR